MLGVLCGVAHGFGRAALDGALNSSFAWVVGNGQTQTRPAGGGQHGGARGRRVEGRGGAPGAGDRCGAGAAAGRQTRNLGMLDTLLHSQVHGRPKTLFQKLLLWLAKRSICRHLRGHARTHAHLRTRRRFVCRRSRATPRPQRPRWRSWRRGGSRRKQSWRARRSAARRRPRLRRGTPRRRAAGRRGSRRCSRRCARAAARANNTVCPAASRLPCLTAAQVRCCV